MFTGLVERSARIAKTAEVAGNRRITVKIDPRVAALRPWGTSTIGESIAISGVCLTVVECDTVDHGELVSFDVVPETLDKTTLGALQVGDAVNLERSLRLGDAIGGHFVSGHVDGTATVRQRKPIGGEILFELSAPVHLLEAVLPKGSVAVDGISLTVIDVGREKDADEGWFSFAAIPHTMELTTLRHRHPGDGVNIETDLISKHIARAVHQALPSAAEINRLIDQRIKNYHQEK